MVGVPYVGPSRSSPQARAATQDPRQHPAPPRGRLQGCHMARRGDALQDIVSGSGLPWESVGPLYIQPGPPGTARGSLQMRSGPLTTRSRDSRAENTLPWVTVGHGSGADTCPGLVLYTSAPHSGGDPMLPCGLPRVL
jgi:hypothetical protein